MLHLHLLLIFIYGHINHKKEAFFPQKLVIYVDFYKIQPCLQNFDSESCNLSFLLWLLILLHSGTGMYKRRKYGCFLEQQQCALINQSVRLPLAAIICCTTLCRGYCCFDLCLLDPATALSSLHADTRGSSRGFGSEPSRQNTEQRHERKIRKAGWLHFCHL